MPQLASRAWLYWPSYPPDASRWETVEWRQGDEEGPFGIFDGPANVCAVEELLAQEHKGWLTVGVWWRPARC